LDRRAVELLKKLWADGLSASQIAGELGGITRNAVIGKVHRLGLSGRAKSPSSSAPRARKPRSHMMRVQARCRRQHRTGAGYEMDQEPEPELIENIIPIGSAARSWSSTKTPAAGRSATRRPRIFFCGGKRWTACPTATITRAPLPAANERRNASAVPAGLTVSPSWTIARRNRGFFFAAHLPV